MPSLKIAHINQQGVDLIIVPLDTDFGTKTRDEQRQAITELQLRSRSAGLKGTVIPVWDGGGGRMAFNAPQNFHPFFGSISLAWVHANLNRELQW